MSYLISNRFKTITTEKIKNSELTKTIEEIKKEIIDAQNSFISNYKRKKILKMRLGQNLNLDKNLSENYYQDIKKIFKKYSLVSACEAITQKTDNYKKCKTNKVNYYNELIKLLDINFLVNGENDFLNVSEYLYLEKKIEYNYSKEIHYEKIIVSYFNKIIDFIKEYKEVLNGKISKHNNRSKISNIPSQNGGKKIITKKDSKKTVKNKNY